MDRTHVLVDSVIDGRKDQLGSGLLLPFTEETANFADDCRVWVGIVSKDGNVFRFPARHDGDSISCELALDALVGRAAQRIARSPARPVPRA